MRAALRRSARKVPRGRRHDVPRAATSVFTRRTPCSPRARPSPRHSPYCTIHPQTNNVKHNNTICHVRTQPRKRFTTCR